MNPFVRILLVAGALLLAAQGACAQAPRVNGVVWTPPAYPQAVADLQRMHAMGVNAVRVPVIDDERLLTAADTLDIQLYQELSTAFLSAPALNDTVAAARRELQQVLRQAAAHPSVRHVGLARHVDTSDPAACAYFDRLAAQIPSPSPIHTYYVTPFVETDRCASSVDAVLIDARGTADPHALLARWMAAHRDAARVGLGALGTWVAPDGPPGLKHAHSPERQARYLEEHLQHAPLDSVSVRFVYRWRDARTDPYGRAFGLLTEDGALRPAAQVVRGIYTGRQRIFAFPAGSTPPVSFPWHMVVGWSVVALIGLIYAREPLFRQTIIRYFWTHTFYHEVVQEGRDTLAGSSLALVTGAAVSLGLLGFATAAQIRYAPEVVHALRALPAPLRETVAFGLDAPWTMGILVAAGYALLLLVWTLGLVAIVRKKDGLTPEQALMLVAWPHWPLLVLMAGPLVASTLAPPAALAVLASMAGACALLVLWITGRVLADYKAVTQLPGAWIALGALLSPVVPVLLAALVPLLRYDVPLRLIGHLLTRS